VRKEGQYHGVKAKESKDIGLDDLFTVADVSIQKTIEYNIKSLFPHVKIVSEEDDENTKDIVPTL
jgi:3'-phosphoadenosine 5'-phosphosulfate (PAPS) 3'-phosphatase